MTSRRGHRDPRHTSGLAGGGCLPLPAGPATSNHRPGGWGVGEGSFGVRWSWPPLQSLWFTPGAGSAKGWLFSLSPERGGQRRTSYSRVVKVETAPHPRCGHVTLLGVCMRVWGCSRQWWGWGGAVCPEPRNLSWNVSLQGSGLVAHR